MQTQTFKEKYFPHGKYFATVKQWLSTFFVINVSFLCFHLGPCWEACPLKFKSFNARAKHWSGSDVFYQHSPAGSARTGAANLLFPMYPLSVPTHEHVPLQRFERWTMNMCPWNLVWQNILSMLFVDIFNNKLTISIYVQIFRNKYNVTIFFSYIANLKGNPSDRQMYPLEYMYPRLGTSALES